MSMKRIGTALAAGCVMTVMSAVPGLAAQAPHSPQHAAADKAKPSSGMEAKCQAMMAEREKMMADIKAADQRLDGLVAKMNAAMGMEKMAATSVVVTELATQRLTMGEGMMKMQHGMMSHMMEHMQDGKDSMAMCPIMKQMGDKQP